MTPRRWLSRGVCFLNASLLCNFQMNIFLDKKENEFKKLNLKTSKWFFEQQVVYIINFQCILGWQNNNLYLLIGLGNWLMIQHMPNISMMRRTPSTIQCGLIPGLFLFILCRSTTLWYGPLSPRPTWSPTRSPRCLQNDCSEVWQKRALLRCPRLSLHA